MIKCSLCGSTLAMKDDFKGAVCPVCGMYYSIDVLKNMFRKGADPLTEDRREAEPEEEKQWKAQPERPWYLDVEDEDLPLPEPVDEELPVPEPAEEEISVPEPAGEELPAGESGGKRVQSSLEPAPDMQGPGSYAVSSVPKPRHQMNNEAFGLALSEYRDFFREEQSLVYSAYPQPKAPGLFASAREKASYERQIAEWRRKEAERMLNLQRHRAIAAEKEAYFRKFYEKTVPQYDLEEDWKPYFEAILREEFPEYSVYKDVKARELFGNLKVGDFQGKYLKTVISFLMVQKGRPVLAVFLLPSLSGHISYQMMVFLESQGIRAAVFRTVYSNRRDYVIDRIRRKLK